MNYLRAFIICTSGAICGFYNYEYWWCVALAIISTLGAAASILMIYLEYNKWKE